MALYDNPLWILSHIRNSFVVSDDTGNSELVLAGDKFPEFLEKIAERESVVPYLKLEEAETEDEFRPKSLEIRVGTNPLGYRPRCNTEIQLEKMKRERKNAPNIRTISWRPPSDELSQEELDKMFPRKEPQLRERAKSDVQPQSSVRSPEPPIPKSLLTQQLTSCQEVDFNYFSNFSHISGVDSENDSKEVRVYLSMCQKLEDETLPYLRAKVKSVAKVFEVVGFVCYLYTKFNRQPSLEPNVDAYSLYLAEDGAVEWDLPTLEAHEAISRYGFNDLALVQVKTSKVLPDYSIKITLPDGTFTVLQLPSKNITLQELMDKAMAKRRKLAQVEKFKFSYNIERTDAPGVALDPNAMLSSVDTSEFFVVRQNSRRFSEHIQIEIDETHCMSAVEACSYKEYPNLKLLTRMRTRLPVVCSISEDKIEIMPHQAYGSSIQMWSAKLESRLIKLEEVVACTLAEKEESVCVICVVYRLEQNYAKLKLECDDLQVGKEMCAKLKYLINERSAEAQTDYAAYKGRKARRRKTIHF